ncbi:MAG TPA: IS110 family transposase [Blastocatellia bacterium]|nr:IS110 family transposase [Blastocatellia bacterium]
MTNIIYCGVDFHARQQTICCLKTETGELTSHELKHDPKEAVRQFYAELGGPVIVGLEASGYTPWFEQLLEALGHQVWLGDATEIRRRARRRQKNDRRDAELILELMLHDEFPRIHRPSPPSQEILRMLRYRHKLVKLRTIVKNSLHSLSLQAGLSLQARLFTGPGKQQLLSAPMSPVMQQQRQQWLELLQELNQRITETEGWLKQQALSDPRVRLLRTHPGVGLLSSLGIVHTLMPVSRFATTRKVAAYGGFDPMERSSADKKRYLGISKAGSRLLRFLLVEATQTAVKTDPELKRFYGRLAQRRGKPKAKVAVARKLLIRSFIMLRDEINYAEFQQRGVAARLAREFARPNMPVPLIGQPASPANG